MLDSIPSGSASLEAAELEMYRPVGDGRLVCSDFCGYCVFACIGLHLYAIAVVRQKDSTPAEVVNAVFVQQTMQVAKGDEEVLLMEKQKAEEKYFKNLGCG